MLWWGHQRLDAPNSCSPCCCPPAKHHQALLPTEPSWGFAPVAGQQASCRERCNRSSHRGTPWDLWSLHMDWEGEGLWTPLSPTGILWNKKFHSDQGSVSPRGLLVASQTSAMWAQPCGAHSYKILLEVNVWLKNMKPRLYVHQNPGRSLFTLLFHFPSNQALAGNNPPRADYTGKIEQLSDHTSSPGRSQYQGERQHVRSGSKWEFQRTVAWNWWFSRSQQSGAASVYHHSL